MKNYNQEVYFKLNIQFFTFDAELIAGYIDARHWHPLIWIEWNLGLYQVDKVLVSNFHSM